MKSSSGRSGRLGAWSVLTALFAWGLGACRAPAPSAEPPREPLTAVLAAHADSLMALPGVVGCYEAQDGGGRPVIRIMIRSSADSIVKRLPRILGGYRVEHEVTGDIRPMR